MQHMHKALIRRYSLSSLSLRSPGVASPHRRIKSKEKETTPPKKRSLTYVNPFVKFRELEDDVDAEDDEELDEDAGDKVMVARFFDGVQARVLFDDGSDG